MNSLVIVPHRLAAVLLLFCASIMSAQSTYKESFNVGKDVLVSVNTSHTNVIFETWSKDKVEVEAFIDDKKLSEKEKKRSSITGTSTFLGTARKWSSLRMKAASGPELSLWEV